jgi:hypothetical protein
MSVGAVDRYLGLLSSTQGRWEEAARHYENGRNVRDCRVPSCAVVTLAKPPTSQTTSTASVLRMLSLRLAAIPIGGDPPRAQPNERARPVEPSSRSPFALSVLPARRESLPRDLPTRLPQTRPLLPLNLATGVTSGQAVRLTSPRRVGRGH